MNNNSPRLSTPWVDSIYPTLLWNLNTDVVVVGAWIAGCMTAYFLLHNTQRSVVLLEGNRIARGATWHNAGQIDVFFETPVKDLIDTYWVDITKEWYQAMFDAWVQLEEIITTIQRQWQYTKYIWYNVYTAKKQLLEVCEQLSLFDKLWLEINELFVREDKILIDDIPEQYREYINWISVEAWEIYIWSKNIEWLFFEATHYATVNSAALCHAMIIYLLVKYPDRFSIYEKVWIENIITDNNITLSTTLGYTISATDIVLCTNAYHSYTINHNVDILHVDSIKWFMAWYYIPNAKVPITIWYQPASHSYTDGYYYHSVRHFSDLKHTDHTLVTVWWPDVETTNEEYPLTYKKDLDGYIKNFYNHAVDWVYYRWWDMWYTDSGLRKIWPHKEHLHIRYNVWCNGVGILWSIHWWRKIAQYFLGWISEKSIFDI